MRKNAKIIFFVESSKLVFALPSQLQIVEVVEWYLRKKKEKEKKNSSILAKSPIDSNQTSFTNGTFSQHIFGLVDSGSLCSQCPPV